MTVAIDLRPAGRAEPHVQEIAENVFAYVQPDGGWCLNNAGILAGDGATVLIDTAATEARTRWLHDTVGEIARRPVELLVNTHSHGDHTFGNHVFATATVVAHREAAAEMAAHGLALQSLWPDVEWGDVRPGLAEVTFTDRLTLPDAGRRVQLLHFGPGHTAGDAVVWLPDERVLFTGDLVFSGATPFVLMGSVRGSLAVLDQLRALEPLHVVPGHGPVGGPELLDANAGYLRWVREVARGGLREGVEPLELARGTALGRYAGLLDSERLVCNLVRAYAEERGAAPAAPLDVVAAFGDMVTLNGAHPHCTA